MKAILNIRKYLVAAISLLLLCAFTGGAAAAVARGYSSDDNDLRPGMVVRLNPDSSPESQKVERATLEDLDRIVGIVVTPEDSDVTIGSVNESVFIETSGEADAFVADLDGPVKKGDLLTLSPLKGILTKGHSSSKLILGIALEDFSTQDTEKYTINTDSGKEEVEVAKIRVNLDRQGSSGQAAGDQPDSSLERLGKSITGREVSEIRMIIAMFIFVIVLVAEGAILYGAISSSITSIGRNPLARNLIKGELIRVIAVTMAVLLIGLAALYGILWV